MWWNVNHTFHWKEDNPGGLSPKELQLMYEAKLERIVNIVEAEIVTSQPMIIGFCEMTPMVAEDIRDRLFPDYQVYSSVTQLNHHSTGTRICVIVPKDDRVEWDIEIAPGVQRKGASVPHVTVPLRGDEVRIFFTHFPSDQDEVGAVDRGRISDHLNKCAFEYLNTSKLDFVARHTVMVGDFNAEPFETSMRVNMNANRSRKESMIRHHNYEKSNRTRLYNLSWRKLGEQHPFPESDKLNEPSVSGTYFLQKESRWITIDQVIASSSLVTGNPPCIRENSFVIIANKDLLDKQGRPRKFSWSSGNPKGQVSDHLPIRFEIQVTES